MRVHERTELYGDLDEYEEEEDLVGVEYEEGEEEEEEEEEENEEEQEDPKPTKDELEYLELRQRLKEEARKRMKKGSSSAIGQSQEKKRKLPYDNYGSFFGPSQPVIARRVIEESRSILETQHIRAKTSNSNSVNKKGPSFAKVETKLNVHNPPPKAINEFKMKAQKLKDTRDYSFLLSDDAEFPAPAKESAPQNILVPTSDARPAQVPSKSKASSMNKSVNLASNGHEERGSISTSRRMQNKVAHAKVAPTSRLERPSADRRILSGGNVGNGPGRPVGLKRPLPKASATTMEKKASAVSVKNYVPVANKAPLSKPQVALPRHYSEQKKEHRVVDKPKVTPKQPMDKSKLMLKQSVPSSKPLMKPPKQMPTRPMRDDRPKKRPVRDYSGEEDTDDGDEAIRMIRSMFRYNPKKYVDDDDDVSDMEANFDDIQKEERRSAKIAREEDEREQRLIEEEERRMRMRKVAKKRKA